MVGSIGSVLASLGALLPHVPSPRTPAGGSAPLHTPDFAAQLDASFRRRAEHLGLELPASTELDGTHAAGRGEGADEIWRRVQAQSAALHGPGDAMMRAVGEAADARWEQRRGGSRSPFEI